MGPFPVSLPGVGLPQVSVPVPDLSSFKPCLVPEEARPLVLAPVYLVKVFARVVVYVVLACIAILAVIIGTVPTQISVLGFLFQIILTLLSFGIFALAMAGVHLKGRELVGQLELLERLAAGDVLAACDVAQKLTVASVSAAGDAVAGVVDGVANFDAGDAIAGGTQAMAAAGGAAVDATGAAVQSAGRVTGQAAQATIGVARGFVGGAFDAVRNPVGAVEGAVAITVDAAGGVAETAGNSVAAAMEMNPLFAFKKIIAQVLRVCLYLVCATPPVLFVLGWFLWKLGIHINGLELMVFGLLLGAVAPVCWLLVSKKATRLMDHAGQVVVDIHVANAKKIMQSKSAEKAANEETPLVKGDRKNPFDFLSFFRLQNREHSGRENDALV